MATKRRRTVDDVPVSNELAEVLALIRKANGDQSITRGNQVMQPYRIPTGVFMFDYATLGGIPHNRMSQFHGPKHSGKTTMGLRAIVGAQQSMTDGQAILVDVEGTYDATWGGKVGVDNEKLLVVKPDTGEQAVDMTVGLACARETSLIVVDSLAALLPHKETEISAEDHTVGLQSKLIGRMLRVMSGALIKERKRGHYITILFINQQRSKIGGFSPSGDPLSLPGGKAVGFFMSLEARFKNREVLKATQGNDELAYNEHAFTIEKNKMNGGMRSGEFRMMRRADDSLGLTEGEIDDAETMLGFAKKYDMLTGGGRGGITLEFGDFSQKFDKTSDAVSFLYENREIYWSLRCSLIASYAQSQGMPESYVNYLLGGE